MTRDETSVYFRFSLRVWCSMLEKNSFALPCCKRKKLSTMHSSFTRMSSRIKQKSKSCLIVALTIARGVKLKIEDVLTIILPRFSFARNWQDQFLATPRGIFSVGLAFLTILNAWLKTLLLKCSVEFFLKHGTSNSWQKSEINGSFQLVSYLRFIVLWLTDWWTFEKQGNGFSRTFPALALKLAKTSKHIYFQRTHRCSDVQFPCGFGR